MDLTNANSYNNRDDDLVLSETKCSCGTIYNLFVVPQQFYPYRNRDEVINFERNFDAFFCLKCQAKIITSTKIVRIHALLENKKE